MHSISLNYLILYILYFANSTVYTSNVLTGHDIKSSTIFMIAYRIQPPCIHKLRYIPKKVNVTAKTVVVCEVCQGSI